MSEYNFVKKFIAEYQKKAQRTDIARQPHGKNQSTYADCEIKHNSKSIMIECKLFKDTRSNSNAFYALLGEIIGLSTKKSVFPCDINTTGILIPKTSLSTFSVLWKKNISKDTGRMFVKNCKLQYLILYDENEETIEFLQYDESSNSWIHDNNKKYN